MYEDGFIEWRMLFLFHLIHTFCSTTPVLPSPWMVSNFMMAQTGFWLSLRSGVLRVPDVKPSNKLCIRCYSCLSEVAYVKLWGSGRSECHIQILNFSLLTITVVFGYSFSSCVWKYFSENQNLQRIHGNTEADGHTMEIHFQSNTYITQRDGTAGREV